MNRNAFLVLLAAVAGWIDALSFTELGQVFTSFQSGNFIFLGLAIDQGDGERLLGAGVSLAAFLAGSALGAYVVRRPELRWSESRLLIPAFAVEWALLVGFAICWQVAGVPGGYSAGRVAMLVMAGAAMGIQGAAIFALRIPGVATNAMTATLTLGGVILGLRGRGAGAAREASPVPGLFVASLCASYVASAFAVSAIGRPSVTSAVPAVVLGLVLLVVIASRAAPQRAAAAG